MRRIRRHAAFVAALLALLLMIAVAIALAPRNDDTRQVRIPTAADG
jgi:hypothetical protein